MTHESVQALVDSVTRALTAVGYSSEPDPGNNTLDAPAYLRVFCKGIPKNKRVDFLNLVFNVTEGEQVMIEGEETVYTIPANVEALIERIQHNLPCS